MAGITSSTGLGSGLDINGLVTQLVSAEGKPAALRLNSKETSLQTNLSALGSLKGALSSLQTAVKGLKLESSFQPRTATSSNTDLFTVSAGSAAVPGGFSLQVSQLAQAAKMRSGDFTNDKALMGSGSLSFSLGDKSFSVATDGATTLAGVRDAINNASDNPGIKATIINVDSGSRLVLTSDKLGGANTITVAATDSDANDGNDLGRLASANLVTLQAPTSAVMTIDGQQVTKDSNTFSDVINGVSITLKKADPAKTETLTIDLDKTAAKNKVNEFIKAYNTMATTLDALGKYDASTKKGGPLLGDATLRGVQNQVRQALSTPVEGMEGVRTLAEIGIKTNDSGALQLDEAMFDKVMAANPETVGKLFTSENGLSKRFDDMLTNYLSSDGGLSSRTKSINKQISDIDDQRNRLDVRMADLQKRLLKQFTAMDNMLGQLSATGSYLTQQLANLPGFTDNSN